MAIAVCALSHTHAPAAEPEAKPPNVVFILIDDLRYDFLSFLDHPWIETPHIDRLAQRAVYFDNAFVTTSLCSPSRASVLTGMYAHAHGVVDNDTPLPRDIITFPKELRKQGYHTALIGKWHMGGKNAEPRPGFDHWISFEGQGPFNDPTFNINGDWVPRGGYTPDLITDYAVDYIRERVESGEPYCLYLSHKSVHEPFTPSARHAGVYEDLSIPRPSTFETTDENTAGKPDWVVKQRDSWHGAGRENLIGFDKFYQHYSECMLGVDESIGRVTQVLEELGELENTLIVFFSDNGYFMGEHGLIDKRLMYEASIRVPLFVYFPGRIAEGVRRDELALSIDLAPTILDLLDVAIPSSMQGESLKPLLTGEAVEWRKDFLYEYFNDFNAVQTPTIFGLRTERYSYITYYGVWDNWELYDLEQDPEQRHNLLADIKYGHNYGSFQTQVQRQSKTLHPLVSGFEKRITEILESTGGRRLPLWGAKGLPQITNPTNE